MRSFLSLLLGLVLLSGPAFSQTYDVLIKNGRIIDGTGNSWYYGNIAVQGGKIAAIGKLDKAEAKRVIDAKGLVVAPGFIDVHAHIEGDEMVTPTADNFIHDGVTSVVTGNCGGSSLDMARYFARLDSVKTSINVASLIGHNTVRRAVMGDAQRDPTVAELAQMEALVEKAMREGAVGLSTGLIYVPGTYSKTPEVVALAKAAAKHGGVYASHIRDEGDNVTEAVSEAIAIGRDANMPVEISHFKVTYKPNWGRSVETLALVDNARKEGLDVTVDQYPYVASSTSLDTTVPTWAFSGGRDSLHARLKDPVIRKQIKQQMADRLKEKQLKSFSYAQVARYGPDISYNGKNISEINQLKGRKSKPMEEAETILEMVESVGRTQMVFFSMDEKDLVRIMQYPFAMVASDAGIAKFGSGMPHPRAYGTNARVLGRYVHDQKVIRLEEAIRRMTSLPAQKFGLRDRGLLLPGMAADIVVFDEATVGDAAEFANPHVYSVGFKYVLVNGEVTVEEGKHTGVRSGGTLKSAEVL
ncbi:N-acyl-D-amino-acid deacylase family protein [Persicitalea jodogahamensis]|uniref:Aminoacylase n=1 Tax=Persicitalea jodogahamensis TaxID=402147 RepID=A0A8J3GB56_9BACT|nr:D-aminoacylase [Persicitalea jodogahamensis]GHB79423.1 aminoacylase [Persicitalea jodogahamensis]